jgi:hypothetical protein
MLAHQRGEHTQAVDSAQAAQATSITKRDPFFASLAHARTAIGHSNLGDRQAASHKALASIPKQFRRNRALATARLALAQLHQRDIDQACATASSVFELMKGSPLPGRMRSLLGDYYRDLITLAPDAAVAREWGDRYRAEWRRA